MSINKELRLKHLSPLIVIWISTIGLITTNTTGLCQDKKPTEKGGLLYPKTNQEKIEILFGDLKSQNVMIRGKVYLKEKKDATSIEGGKSENNLNKRLGDPKTLISKEKRKKEIRAFPQSKSCYKCPWCKEPLHPYGFTKCTGCGAFVPDCKQPCLCSGLEV